MSMWNAITVARAGRACLAGAVLAIVSSSLAEAEYGPRTAIGANYQQSSSTMSTNGITESGDYSGRFSCYILFQRAPHRKGLIVQHASCVLSLTEAGLHAGFLLTRKGQTFPLKSTPLLPVNPTGISWVVNNSVMHLLKVGERPIVRFVSTGTVAPHWSVECNISGQLERP